MSADRLISLIQKKNNPTVVGLDPKLAFIPSFIMEKSIKEYGKTLEAAADAIEIFNMGLIDALYDIVPAIKPQSAYYEMYGLPGLRAMQKTIAYAKKKGLYVILDVKRNDIGTTAQAYSAAYLGKTDICGQNCEAFPVDAVTINAYLGSDGIEPFIKDCIAYDKAMFILVKTSNPSSGQLQDLSLGDMAVYEKMAELVNGWGDGTIGSNGYSSIGAVVGATYPAQAKVLRSLMPHAIFLVPGYGAQGGSAADVRPAFHKDGKGAIVNSSRGIMCAYQSGGFSELDYALAARNEALRMQKELNEVCFG